MRRHTLRSVPDWVFEYPASALGAAKMTLLGGWSRPRFEDQRAGGDVSITFRSRHGLTPAQCIHVGIAEGSGLSPTQVRDHLVILRKHGLAQTSGRCLTLFYAPFSEGRSEDTDEPSSATPDDLSGHADDERSEDADCLSEGPDSEGSGSSDSSPGSSDADASDREMPIKSGSTDRGSAKADKPSGLADKPSVLADHYKEILISPDLSDQKDPVHARARETNPTLPFNAHERHSKRNGLTTWQRESSAVTREVIQAIRSIGRGEWDQWLGSSSWVHDLGKAIREHDLDVAEVTRMLENWDSVFAGLTDDAQRAVKNGRSPHAMPWRSRVWAARDWVRLAVDLVRERAPEEHPLAVPFPLGGEEFGAKMLTQPVVGQVIVVSPNNGSPWLDKVCALVDDGIGYFIVRTKSRKPRPAIGGTAALAGAEEYWASVRAEAGNPTIDGSHEPSDEDLECLLEFDRS